MLIRLFGLGLLIGLGLGLLVCSCTTDVDQDGGGTGAECTPTGNECGTSDHCTTEGHCAPGPATGGGESFASCKHIDLVIGVDNSGSMQEEKSALRDVAFPGFATALINVAGGIDDFRVGVLDACPRPANFHTRGMTGACNFQSGKVWMESSSSALVDEFKCVGNVDSSDMQCSGDNDDEQPATAVATSLETAWQAPGMPNAGFSRDDSLLVVIAITDEDEQPTPSASAQQTYDRIVAAKGDASRVVFLGIGGASSCSNGAYGSAKSATKLKETTALFGSHGVFWDLCQGNLDQGLTEALQTIDAACQNFGPIL